jgi:hypothetical protein
MSEQLTRDRIADERNWCQGRKNEFGKSVDGEQGDRKACGRRCALWLVRLRCGSLSRCWSSLGAQVFGTLRSCSFSTTSHAEVVALLDDVIARLEEHEFGDPLPVPVDE